MTPALLCVSHLRWNFVFQRPQHLMTRAARERPVYYLEEAVFSAGPDHLACERTASGVTVCVPQLCAEWGEENVPARTAALLERLLRGEGVTTHDLWLYTPLALPVTAGLRPRAVVYDCMDELANFRGASPHLRALERDLLARADVVFTGGRRLYEAKQGAHPNVHCFPSSVDTAHFAQARTPRPDPEDQRAIPHPRLGFAGVLDERLDVALLAGLARRRPDWQFVLVGPVVKIDPGSLPRDANVHYLGMQPYAALPDHLARWDVALLPFARNEATEFISPTKTPEYLAAGLPVVSTSIRDVVRPYGERGLVRIADAVDAFEAAVAAALGERGTAEGRARQERADAFLAGGSWDATWAAMRAALEQAAQGTLEAADD